MTNTTAEPTSPPCRYAERPEHVCVDNQGNPVAGTDKVCFYEARSEVFGDMDPDA